MSKKRCKARRLTETTLKRLDDAVEKHVLILGERFGECDEAIVRMADDLLRDLRAWADELREHMEQKETIDGETWEL